MEVEKASRTDMTRGRGAVEWERFEGAPDGNCEGTLTGHLVQCHD